MIIFSHTLTPRLQYVVDFLSQYFRVPIRIICDEGKYSATQDPHRINYSYHRISKDEIWIHSHVLLFETAIRQVKVDCFEHNGYKAFFKTEGDTGFDLLAGLFYLITRYEEYLSPKKDKFGRFAHQDALAFKEDFLHQPVINFWLQDFRKLLKQKFPDLKVQTPSFRFQPTYDIDMAWSYRNKGIKRNAGALATLLFTGRWGRLAERVRVLRGIKQDPFDTYDWMDELHRKFSLHPIYFFLVALKPGRFDKNIDVKNPAFRSLVQDIASKYKTGLHPSYASNEHGPLLPKEKKTLEEITERPVQISRQHFIKFDLPLTFRRLVSLGITEDYSMGYGSINGFRASIATPFYWYDLKAEAATSLLIYPFCFMEATAYYEQKLTPDEALKDMQYYYEVVKKVNGTLVTIWHNSFLGTDPAFEGWSEVYRRFIEFASAAK